MESADESSRLLEEEMDVKPPPLPPSPPQLPSSSLPQLSSPPLPPQLPSSSPPQLLPPLQLPPLPQPPPPPPELPSSPPPQPPLPAQLPLPPSPPPPPSMQTSNQNTDMLDFDSDVGGNTNHTENQDAVMDDAMTSEEGSEQKDSSEGEIHAVNECGQHKRKAPVQEPMETNHKSKCLHSDPKPDIEDEVNWVAIEQASGPPKHTVSQQNKHELEQSVSGAPDRPISPSNGKQEFEIIDDIGSEEDGGYEFDSDMDEDEIDALLDAGMQNYRQGSNEEDEFNAPVERDKTVLKEHGHDPFDILPEGWVAVTHNSGMPVYLHKSSRVCTHSRPYFLGPGSARKHDIPLSAIPCLQYRRELDNQQLEASGSTPTATTNGVSTGEEDGSPPATDSKPEKEPPIVRVECLEKYQKEKMLKFMEVREYCERLFEFQIITIKKYRTWKDRRKHHKLLKHNARPSLPSSTKLITCPILLNKQEEKVNRKKEFVLNPVGKSDICILHEYVQHAMRIQPHYIIKELENAQTPYSATVLIHNVEYGVGYASSKKAAKNEAAKMTLGILIPELKESKSNNQDIQDLSFFDEVKIQDPRVHDLCHKAGQPGPFQILCECLRRNFGMGDTNCKMEMKTLKHQKSEFTMLVGKHSATVICKNKREGKQFAAQAILQKLHPHIHSWGSLLRLYGTDWKAIKEKEEELSVTSLHGQAAQCMPNTAILSKLKGEMKKLQLRRRQPSYIFRQTKDDEIVWNLPRGSDLSFPRVEAPSRQTSRGKSQRPHTHQNYGVWRHVPCITNMGAISPDSRERIIPVSHRFDKEAMKSNIKGKLELGGVPATTSVPGVDL